MKAKKMIALFMALTLVLMAAACGNSEGTQKDTQASKETASVSGTQGTADAQAPESAAESDAAEAASGDYNVTWEDMENIVVIFPSMGPIPSGLQAVEDAINEITEEEINTHVTLKIIEVGNFDQQVTLMISSNEQLDLMVTMPGGPLSLNSMAAQNQLTDITELLGTYAPKALDGVGELIKAEAINGRVLAFPTYKGYASGMYINMRTDVLEDLGLLDKALNMKSFTEYEEILEAVKNSEKWSYLAGVVATDGHGSVLPEVFCVSYSDKFEDCKMLDNLGNTQFITVARYDGSNKVLNPFKTEEFRANYELVRSWYEKGYVYKDSPTTSEMGTALIKSNVGFSHISQIELGAEASQDINCGTDMTSVLILKRPLTTGTLTKFTWAVPTTAKAPEAAVTFIEMMFNDARIANLMAWGIEGTDYEVDNEGVAHFIEGNENPAYHGVAFLSANQFLVYPWEGDDPNVNEIYKKYMDEAEYSPYLGFSADVSDLSEETSAISNVYAEYQGTISSGTADEEVFAAYLEKLDKSGIDKIVNAYQEQLDAWLEVIK